MSQALRGQVSANAAEVYEEFFVPALFAQWPPRIADAAEIVPGQRVLDVACGTGVLARHLTGRVGDAALVHGLDVNENMLAVARRSAPHVEWRHGRAESLPYGSDSFDAVVCQFGLMFFEDRQRALTEMLRVLRPAGRLAVAVWDRIEAAPGYAAVAALLQRLFGSEVADALRAPFGLGDVAQLRSLFAAAGMADAEVRTCAGSARFPSIDAWIHTDVKGWTLRDMIDAAQYARLREEAQVALRRFAGEDGSVAFAAPAHIVTARKP